MMPRPTLDTEVLLERHFGLAPSTGNILLPRSTSSAFPCGEAYGNAILPKMAGEGPSAPPAHLSSMHLQYTLADALTSLAPPSQPQNASHHTCDRYDSDPFMPCHHGPSNGPGMFPLGRANTTIHVAPINEGHPSSVPLHRGTSPSGCLSVLDPGPKPLINSCEDLEDYSPDSSRQSAFPDIPEPFPFAADRSSGDPDTFHQSCVSLALALSSTSFQTERHLPVAAAVASINRPQNLSPEINVPLPQRRLQRSLSTGHLPSHSPFTKFPHTNHTQTSNRIRTGPAASANHAGHESLSVHRIHTFEAMSDCNDDSSTSPRGHGSFNQPIDPDFDKAVASGNFEKVMRPMMPSFAVDSEMMSTGYSSCTNTAASEETTDSDHTMDKTGDKTDRHVHAATLDADTNAELDLRVNRARQSMDYVNWRLDQTSQLRAAHMNIYKALDLLDEVGTIEGFGTPSGMKLKDKAICIAELCRIEFPEYEWAPMLGLIHSLGQLLGHPKFGQEPRWAVLGETYPLGCAFSEDITGHQFLSVCPDRRRRIYSSHFGIYGPECGFKNVYFTWSAAEYMFTMLLLNDCRLPAEALFLIRYQRFDSLYNHGAYHHLMSDEDRSTLPLLRRFIPLLKKAESMRHVLSNRDELLASYEPLMARYLGSDSLDW